LIESFSLHFHTVHDQSRPLLNPGRHADHPDSLVPTAAGPLASSRGMTPRGSSTASAYGGGGGGGAAGVGGGGQHSGRPTTALGHTSAAQAAQDMIRELGIKGAMRARPRSAMVMSTNQHQQQQHYATAMASARLHGNDDVINYDGV
jgi:hypothetical protein